MSISFASTFMDGGFKPTAGEDASLYSYAGTKLTVWIKIFKNFVFNQKSLLRISTKINVKNVS